MLKFAVISCVIFAIGCVSGHCGRDGKGKKETGNNKVFVFKYDGSRQCEKSRGVDLDVMSDELGKIKIHSKMKRSDGQIRVQVCGALTGMTNVYEISEKDVAKAEALGFKKWDF